MLSIHFARCVCRPVQLLMVLSSRERLSKLQRDIVVSLNYSYHIALQFNSFIYFSPCNRSNDDFCDFLSFAWERGECWACFAVNQFALILKFNCSIKILHNIFVPNYKGSLYTTPSPMAAIKLRLFSISKAMCLLAGVVVDIKCQLRDCFTT